MGLKKVFYVLLLSVFCAEVGLAQNQDSTVILQVFNALTGKAVNVPANTDKLLLGHEWEALAYWDTKTPAEPEYMQEAVGDIYQFIAKSFTIKAVNPEDPASYLPAITGTFIRTGNALVLTSQSGKNLAIGIIFLDDNYLILEMDGLRIFFTKTRSFNAN